MAATTWELTMEPAPLWALAHTFSFCPPVAGHSMPPPVKDSWCWPCLLLQEWFLQVSSLFWLINLFWQLQQHTNRFQFLSTVYLLSFGCLVSIPTSFDESIYWCYSNLQLTSKLHTHSFPSSQSSTLKVGPGNNHRPDFWLFIFFFLVCLFCWRLCISFSSVMGTYFRSVSGDCFFYTKFNVYSFRLCSY